MILFVNACVRGDRSRTYALCREYLGGLKKRGAKVREVDLQLTHLSPLSDQKVAFRSQLARRGVFEDDIFDLAHQFAEADQIVIGAPYWDLSFPAALKTYIEHVSVDGITFRFTPDARYVGLCRARRITYITTSGSILGVPADDSSMGATADDSPYAARTGFAPAPGCNLGYDYVCAIAKMFGIPEVRYASAEGLDAEGVNINDSMEGCRAQLSAFLADDADELEAARLAEEARQTAE